MERRLLLTFFDDGLMSALYKAGFIGVKAFLYRDIYLWVDAQVKIRKISKTQAVLEAEIKFDRSEATIWNALKSFE